MPKATANENPLPPAQEMDVSSLFSVKGKVCVVTGGGSGIGAMIAAGYCGNGAKVYITSRKDTSTFATQLTERGPGSCISISSDLSKEEDVVKLAKEIEKLEPQGIDVLVNNAGTNWSDSFDSYPLDAWSKVYNLNVRSVFHCSQVFAPMLEKKATAEDPGRIINISSIDSSQVTSLPTFAYSSGKAAVNRLTKVMAGHLSSKNITVNAILPGPFQSRMMRATLEAAGDAIADRTPRGRIGDLKDMSGCAIYLASRAGAW
eukprot:CAMPEP_0184022190 /NCGR_PEP_ID=MMETSP0954-20121128/10448_1 /TAXON_ID=627963 /ORGANISM="Aplanochytrium sp, Strain PBS07" /LENGTH=259 /DNA_ID=CAMNT_0026304497 /DNA_START=43 /DNA_END=819 /DNA_ORIENTATION=+